MNHAIELRLRAGKGFIIRTLDLAERRGFRLRQVRMKPPVDGHLLHLGVSSPIRSIEVLARQLERRHDVIDEAVNCDQSIEYSAGAVSGE